MEEYAMMEMEDGGGSFDHTPRKVQHLIVSSRIKGSIAEHVVHEASSDQELANGLARAVKDGYPLETLAVYSFCEVAVSVEVTTQVSFADNEGTTHLSGRA